MLDNIIILKFRLPCFHVSNNALFFTFHWYHDGIFPGKLWDHALQRRAWIFRVNAKKSAFAVDGNSSTAASTYATKYPFLAVDLGMTLKIDYMVLNIKQGKWYFAQQWEVDSNTKRRTSWCVFKKWVRAYAHSRVIPLKLVKILCD